MTKRTEVSSREREAWEQRYKHGKAARIWAAVAEERPESAEVSLILADWMTAYETADAEAERRFRDLAGRVGGAA